MNKLVSKNPVLRFKLGKKILKFLNPAGNLPVPINKSLPVLAPDADVSIVNLPSVVKKNVPSTIKRVLPAAKRFIPLPLGRFLGPIGLLGSVYDMEQRRKEVADKLASGEYSMSNGQLIENEAAKGAVVGSAIGKPRTYSNSNMVTPSLEYKLALKDFIYSGEGVGKVNGKPKGIATPKNRINTPKLSSMFMGVKAGNAGAFNLTDELKSLLDLNGIKYGTALELQKGLNEYLSSNGIKGSILADNKWGDLSKAALDYVLNRIKNQKAALPVLPSNVIYQSPITPLENVPEFKPQILNVRNHSYNRADIRNLIRQAGFNPYNFSAVQRRDLRKYLNGESDDVSQLGGTPLYRFTIPYTLQLTLELPQQQTTLQTQQEKKLHPAEYKRGGLISRNPVERFKRNFIKVDQ